jgi:calcium-dependent protein kinase
MPKVNTDNVLGKPPGAKSVDQDYELGKVLGKGAFGTVRLATSKVNGDKLACKSIAKAKLVCREDVLDVQREVAIMNHVAGHPNVVNSKVRAPQRRSCHFTVCACWTLMPSAV